MSNEQMQQGYEDHLAEADNRIQELEQEVGRLRTALEKYGRHLEDCDILKKKDRRYCPHCNGAISRHPTYDTEPEFDVYRCVKESCISFQAAWSIKYPKEYKCTCGLEQALKGEEK